MPGSRSRTLFLASAAPYRSERILDDHSRFWLDCQQRGEGHFRNRGLGGLRVPPKRNSSLKLAMTGSITWLTSLAQTRFYPRVFLSPQCTESRGSGSRVNLARCWSRASIRLTLGGRVGVRHPRCPRSKLPVGASAGDSPVIGGALHFSQAVSTAFIC